MRYELTLGFAVVLVAAGAAAANPMTITSPKFAAGADIPAQYTCEGTNTPPPLTWKDAPANTKTFALIVDDPDAPKGDFVHWVLFNLPSGTQGLPEGGSLASGATQGRNDRGSAGYTGPCPPSGRHHYRFRLFALDARLSVTSSSPSKADLERAMEGHILAKAELVATFQKRH